MILLGAGDVRTGQTAGALDLNTLGTTLHSAADALLHGAAERDAALQLAGNVLSNQLSVGVDVANLNDVHVGGLADHLLDLLTQLLDLSTLLANDHAGLCAVDVHAQTGRTVLRINAALDLDLGHAGSVQLLLQGAADLVILDQGVAEFLLGSKPAAVPILDNAHANAVGIDFLAHCLPPYSFSFRTTVMWLVRFRMRYARP